MRLSRALVSSVLLSTGVAQATPEDSLTIIETEIGTPDETRALIEARLGETRAAVVEKDVDIDPSTIWNIAKQIWDIILENRGVARTEVDYANALPRGLEDASELTGMSSLQMKTFKLQAKNYLDQVIVDIDYTVVHQYGGSYQGVGRYLSTVSVIPSKIWVGWGCSVDFKTTRVVVSNHGTAEMPVAGLVMETRMDIQSLTTAAHVTKLFELHGDSPEIISLTP
jgi:hypothetical protein